MEAHSMEKVLRDMDGIRIDSGVTTELDSAGEVENDDTSNDHALFEVRLSAGKGLGLFALVDIPRGMRLIAEPALIILPTSEPDFKHIWKDFKKLTPHQFDQMGGLSSVSHTVKSSLQGLIRHRLSTQQQYSGTALDAAVKDEMQMRAIFNTNAVAMGMESLYGRGLFLLSSRLNHSCVPNVFQDYNVTLEMTTVHATRAIKEGEELTLSYCQHVRNNHEERAEVLDFWEFKCDCPACKGPEVSVREKLRRRIVELATGLAKYDLGSLDYATPSNHSKALVWGEEVLLLLREQGLEDMVLAPAYRKCSRYCVQLGQMEKAMAYARKELEVQRYCLGTETAHMEMDMEGAEFWIKHVEQMAEKDRVKIAMNQKRTRKEDKKAEKKAAKKAVKGGR
ncbi:hypothetical protein LTR36_009136 [Oleoguttula mirabilis]|uniref:SET domain-containing protein n=1 Tax=Oleoguttula mirabilis TaxID=1507867 RepID=A0AAV9J6J1_9PEZI|nr:hypothetical protein LTR36_009136 [Oleoguttula mirabilis]